jgi:predicted alpha/beta-fold hydrolase
VKGYSALTGEYFQDQMQAPHPTFRIIDSDFKPAWWLTNRHWQTIYPSLPWAGAPRVALRSETLDLPDGDSTVVDWLVEAPETAGHLPLLVILHGLESSAEASYAQMLLASARDRGWNACVLHFRDCGDYRNKLPRRYHAGETNDIRYFLKKQITDGQTGPIFAAGYSLGGNVLLKYLGEDGATTPLVAAAAVSAPLNLAISASALNIGFSKFYQRLLLKRMKESVRRKFDRHTAAFDWQRAMSAATFAEFDDAVTAPLHGFEGIDDYYGTCSAAQFLKRIDRPTLIVNSLDDPFMTPEAIPDENELSDCVTIEASNGGGHVGFIEGGHPFRPRYYLPNRIIQFLDRRLQDSVERAPALPGM